MPKPGSDSTSQGQEAATAKFLEGFALHEQGNLNRARELYRQVLELEPRHFDALHLLGVIALQTKEPERAVELIGRAIEIRPDVAEAHSNRANALLALKRHQDALHSCDKAISLKPDCAE